MRPRALTGVRGVFVFGQQPWQSTLSPRNECNHEWLLKKEPTQ